MNARRNLISLYKAKAYPVFSAVLAQFSRKIQNKTPVAQLIFTCPDNCGNMIKLSPLDMEVG
jgi:hypothetical protein